MRLKTLFTVLFALGLAAMAFAQESEYSFYEAQARKDFHYEQSLVLVSNEDVEDYWKDQARFERDLKKHDGNAYNVYMNEKKTVYAEHAKSCGEQCRHGRDYYQHALLYFTYTDDQYLSKEAIESVVQIASPRIF